MQIKLLTLDSSEYTLEQQLRKISEEHHEAISLSSNLGKYYRELAGELLDLMQACKTVLEILEKDYGDEHFIENANEIHILKLKQRHAEGRIRLEDEDDE